MSHEVGILFLLIVISIIISNLGDELCFHAVPATSDNGFDDLVGMELSAAKFRFGARFFITHCQVLDRNVIEQTFSSRAIFLLL